MTLHCSSLANVATQHPDTAPTTRSTSTSMAMAWQPRHPPPPPPKPPPMQKMPAKQQVDFVRGAWDDRIKGKKYWVWVVDPDAEPIWFNVQTMYPQGDWRTTTNMFSLDNHGIYVWRGNTTFYGTLIWDRSQKLKLRWDTHEVNCEIQEFHARDLQPPAAFQWTRGEGHLGNLDS